MRYEGRRKDRQRMKTVPAELWPSVRNALNHVERILEACSRTDPYIKLEPFDPRPIHSAPYSTGQIARNFKKQEIEGMLARIVFGEAQTYFVAQYRLLRI